MLKQTCSLLIVLLMSIIGFSQKMVIRGNVDSIPDVNIWLYGTEYGTSSNKNGEYSFTIPNALNPLLLQFTKIGYADTVIQLFSSFNYQDSVFLKVSLKEIAYNIEEVNISSQQYFYNAPNAIISDVNFNKSGIITVLITKQNKSEIILLNDFGEIITSLLLETKYNSIFYDCFENIELIGRDSCLQIYFNIHDKVLQKVDIFSKSTFNNKLKPCVLHVGCKYILTNYVPDDYSTYVNAFHNKKIGFYIIDICDSLKKKNGFKTFFDKKAFEVSSSIYRQIIALYFQLSKESDNVIANNLWNGNILKLMVLSDDLQKQHELYELIYRYLLLDSEPIDVKVFNTNNEMIFVNLSNKYILRYDSNFVQIDSLFINFSKEQSLMKEVIQDRKTQKIYLVYIKNGIYYLGELNTKTGNISSLIKANIEPFPRLFRVYNNYSYTVYYDNTKRATYILQKSLQKSK